MIPTTPFTMIDFKPVSTKDKALFDEYLPDGNERGCEFSFANLCLWGRQSYALVHNHIVLFSQFDHRFVYPYPIGTGDIKATLDAIIDDAHARSIPCRITGVSATAKETMEALYPDRFHFRADEGSFDYVYAIDDLAELKGKKFHSKRNHINRFKEAHPDYTVEILDESNLPQVRAMLDEWYRNRLAENPDSDFHLEQEALARAFTHFRELALDGLVLRDGERILAFTVGSRMNENTVDVHFEKARHDVQGAYSVINYEFARYIREKYPDIQFLDREEDMGIEGLRKTKRSYYPHRQIIKYLAYLGEEDDDD